MKSKKKLICAIGWLLIPWCTLSQISEKITVTDQCESPNSFISYVTIAGRHYVIKQKINQEKQIIAVMREALASYIAKDLKIAQSVEIIDATENIPGKKYAMYPATLHTLAPGKIVSALRGHKYYLLCLKQRDPQGKKITGKWLTETIINQITWHKHIALIIALDLFICNTDRNRRNLFYDEATDSFCAIDMENIYRRNVAKMACKKLREMINVNHKKFTLAEIEALKIVKNTLQFLSKKYPPKDIIAHMYTYADRAGYVNDGSLLNDKLTKKIERHKEMVVECYDSVQKLIKILTEITRLSL
ncbi:MAG TPA: hypothetical protein VKU36_00100 [Candidatus Babeliales bacterium]|nr:hypothetical protein [Candidatus Babeliales bacterium]